MCKGSYDRTPGSQPQTPATPIRCSHPQGACQEHHSHVYTRYVALRRCLHDMVVHCCSLTRNTHAARGTRKDARSASIEWYARSRRQCFGRLIGLVGRLPRSGREDDQRVASHCTRDWGTLAGSSGLVCRGSWLPRSLRRPGADHRRAGKRPIREAHRLQHARCASALRGGPARAGGAVGARSCGAAGVLFLGRLVWLVGRPGVDQRHAGKRLIRQARHLHHAHPARAAARGRPAVGAPAVGALSGAAGLLWLRDLGWFVDSWPRADEGRPWERPVRQAGRCGEEESEHHDFGRRQAGGHRLSCFGSASQGCHAG